MDTTLSSSSRKGVVRDGIKRWGRKTRNTKAGDVNIPSGLTEVIRYILVDNLIRRYVDEDIDVAHLARTCEELLGARDGTKKVDDGDHFDKTRDQLDDIIRSIVKRPPGWLLDSASSLSQVNCADQEAMATQDLPEISESNIKQHDCSIKEEDDPNGNALKAPTPKQRSVTLRNDCGLARRRQAKGDYSTDLTPPIEKTVAEHGHQTGDFNAVHKETKIMEGSCQVAPGESECTSELGLPELERICTLKPRIHKDDNVLEIKPPIPAPRISRRPTTSTSEPDKSDKSSRSNHSSSQSSLYSQIYYRVLESLPKSSGDSSVSAERTSSTWLYSDSTTKQPDMVSESLMNVPLLDSVMIKAHSPTSESSMPSSELIRQIRPLPKPRNSKPRPKFKPPSQRQSVRFPVAKTRVKPNKTIFATSIEIENHFRSMKKNIPNFPKGLDDILIDIVKKIRVNKTSDPLLYIADYLHYKVEDREQMKLAPIKFSGNLQSKQSWIKSQSMTSMSKITRALSPAHVKKTKSRKPSLPLGRKRIHQTGQKNKSPTFPAGNLHLDTSPSSGSPSPYRAEYGGYQRTLNAIRNITTKNVLKTSNVSTADDILLTPKPSPIPTRQYQISMYAENRKLEHDLWRQQFSSLRRSPPSKKLQNRFRRRKLSVFNMLNRKSRSNDGGSKYSNHPVIILKGMSREVRRHLSTQTFKSTQKGQDSSNVSKKIIEKPSIRQSPMGKSRWPTCLTFQGKSTRRKASVDRMTQLAHRASSPNFMASPDSFESSTSPRQPGQGSKTWRYVASSNDKHTLIGRIFSLILKLGNRHQKLNVSQTTYTSKVISPVFDFEQLHSTNPNSHRPSTISSPVLTNSFASVFPYSRSTAPVSGNDEAEVDSPFIFDAPVTQVPAVCTCAEQTITYQPCLHCQSFLHSMNTRSPLHTHSSSISSQAHHTI